MTSAALRSFITDLPPDRADGCDMTFEQALAFHAESMVKRPFRWWVGERNGVWALDVWVGNERNLGDAI